MGKSSPVIKIVMIALNIMFIAAMVWIFAFLIPSRYRKEDTKRMDLIRHGRYSIGNTLRSKYVQEGHVQRQIVDYDFTVKGVLHNSFFYPDKIFTVPQRYYIKFCVTDIDNNRIYAIPVPDSIKTAPDNGWNHIPGTRFTVATIDGFKNNRVSLDFHFSGKEYHPNIFNDSISKSDIGKACYISFCSTQPEDDVVIYSATVTNMGTNIPSEGWTTEPWIK